MRAIYACRSEENPLISVDVGQIGLQVVSRDSQTMPRTSTPRPVDDDLGGDIAKTDRSDDDQCGGAAMTDKALFDELARDMCGDSFAHGMPGKDANIERFKVGTCQQDGTRDGAKMYR